MPNPNQKLLKREQSALTTSEKQVQAIKQRLHQLTEPKKYDTVFANFRTYREKVQRRS